MNIITGTLRERIDRMAADHRAMQEALMKMGKNEVPAALEELDRHAAALSALATEWLAVSHAAAKETAQETR